MADPFLGEIRMFAGNFAPRGWAFCDGSILPISQNQALFSLLGVTYGGNGTSTFALPDLRGRVATGMGTGPGLSPVELGQSAGSQTTSLRVDQLPVHAPVATFQGALSNAVASVPVGTSTSEPLMEPVAGGTTYLSAVSVTQGRNEVTVNGLYTTTAPTAPAHIGGTSVTGNVTGSVTIAPVGGNQPISIAQPYLGVSFIIALEGIFPSRQ